MKILKPTSIIILFCMCLLSCKGGLPGADARKVPYDPKERVKKNLEEGKGFRLMDIAKDQGSGNFEFASSNALWRASLDIIDFMPLTSANYSGGILITDWYSDNQNTNQSIKITIRFLTNEVRSDALDIKVFLKKCNTLNSCEISENEGNLKTELNKKILKKAAIYAKQQKDENFKPYKGLKNPRN